MASGPTPLKSSGEKNERISIEIGPPIIIPIVPVKNIISALYPKLYMAFKSILKVISNNAAGNKYLLAIKYVFDSSEEIIPRELKMAGRK